MTELSRRDFLKAATSTALLAGACQPTRPTPTATGTSIELLVTESPVSLYDKREVYARTRVTLAALNTWYRYDLRGARPEHRYAVALRHTGKAVELTAEIRLDGTLWKSLTATYSADRPFSQLWLSRGYIHDATTNATCFPVPEAQKPFEAKLWFATFDPRNRALAKESRQSFDYSATPSGRTTVQLHDGYQFLREWRVHPDGLGHDYVSRWSLGDRVLSEISESVIGLAAMRDAACTALATASYCDTDDI